MSEQEPNVPINPEAILGYIRKDGGRWLASQLETGVTCSCGNCHLCLYRVVEQFVDKAKLIIHCDDAELDSDPVGVLIKRVKEWLFNTRNLVVSKSWFALLDIINTWGKLHNCVGKSYDSSHTVKLVDGPGFVDTVGDICVLMARYMLTMGWEDHTKAVISPEPTKQNTIVTYEHHMKAFVKHVGSLSGGHVDLITKVKTAGDAGISIVSTLHEVNDRLVYLCNDVEVDYIGCIRYAWRSSRRGDWLSEVSKKLALAEKQKEANNDD